MAAVYHIFSLTVEEPNVGIWYLNRDLIGQPVRLAVDLIVVIPFDIPSRGYKPHTACSGEQYHPFKAAILPG